MLILAEMKKNPSSTLTEIAKNINRGQSTVERVASELTKAGKIEREGSKRTGTWKVITK